LSKKFEILEFVKLGAIQLTLTFGANSAAKAKVRPSIAPFADETIAWFGKPCFTATVENKTTEPLFFFKLSAKVLITSVAEIRFKLNDCMKSLFFVSFNGFKSIDPTQKAKPLIGSSFKSFSIFSEKFSSKTSQTVNVEFKFFANSDKLFSSLPTKCTCSPLSTNFFAKEEPIDPVAPKITFFIIKNNIIKGYLHANNDACNI